VLWDLKVPLPLEYECLVEIGSSKTEILRIMNFGSPEEQDLFTSLRGLQLHSTATVTGKREQNPKNVAINFTFVDHLCQGPV
jgi:hypothetical protein